MRRLITTLALAVGLAGLAACDEIQATAEALLPVPNLPPSGAEFDLGGDVLLRAGEVNEVMRNGGTTYEVARECWSACAMLTGVPNACFDPEGFVAIHSARVSDEAALVLGMLDKDPEEVVDRLNHYQAFYMHPMVRQVFLAPGGPAETRSTDFTIIPNAQLIRPGGLKACPEA